MRTMVLGARGQLGRDLVAVFAGAGETVGFDVPELNIVNPDAVSRVVGEFRPGLVVNAAAYTDVEGAEDHRCEAFQVNETGARNVAQVCAYLDVPIVYYSTDFVFAGDKATPYEPDDPPAPLGAYAESKAAGERAVREANLRHFIIRTAWLYGPGGNNFVEKILRAAAARPELKVVIDEVGSPTHTLDLAEATRVLCRAAAYGTCHAVNSGSCSRFEFAQAILELAGLATSLRPCAAAEFPSKARRPKYSVLSNARLEAACGHTMRPWRVALKDYMSRRSQQA